MEDEQNSIFITTFFDFKIISFAHLFINIPKSNEIRLSKYFIKIIEEDSIDFQRVLFKESVHFINAIENESYINLINIFCYLKKKIKESKNNVKLLERITKISKLFFATESEIQIRSSSSNTKLNWFTSFQSEITCRQFIENKGLRNLDLDNNKSIKSLSSKNILALIENYFQFTTFISYNSGFYWSEIFFKGNRLNLKILPSFMNSPLVSYQDIPGLIISNGNTGRYLQEFEENNQFVYLSRDWGRSWRKIGKGQWLKSSLDRGGIIIISKEVEMTNSIKFSWDYGQSFKTMMIEDNITFMNVFRSNSKSAMQFIFTGIKLDNSTPTGFVLTVDFSNFFTKNCEASDFTFLKSLNNFNECIGGQQDFYNFRISNKICQVGDYQINKFQTKICKCTPDDFVCAQGFYKSQPNNQCLPLPGNENLLSPWRVIFHSYRMNMNSTVFLNLIKIKMIEFLVNIYI